MKGRKQIALVSATFNAVNPLTDYIRKNAPDIKPVNYLDGYLMEKIQREGITDEAKLRIMDLITRACNDGADGIILTCTIFSLYQPHFSGIFSRPIVTPDGAMLDKVSKLNGRKAMLCTFEGTVKTTHDNYVRYCRRNNSSEEIDVYAVPDAFKAIQEGRMQESYEIIRDKIRSIDSMYDQIVLAQISMAGAADGFDTAHAELFTSPASAVDAIRKLV